MDIIPKLSEKAKEKAKTLLIKRIEELPEYNKEEVPNTCSFDDQLIHAKKSALINMERDPNAKDLSEEFVYMYLSHYVDIPPEYLGSCNENDEEPYLANWITNEDRSTYRNFLQNIHKIEVVEKCRQFFADISELGDWASFSKEVFF